MFTTLLTVMVLDQGGLFNDVESIVWVFNARDGFHTTTADEWEALKSNSTALTDDAVSISYLRSIGNTRVVFFTVFVATAAWASIYHPTECSILKNAARRSVIGGSQEEGIKEAPSTASVVGSARHSMLDAESVATVNRLGSDDDEVIVFMPAEQIVIPDGPKRSILCLLLLGNHRMAKRINDFLEEHKVWGQIPLYPCLIIPLCALTEVIPLNWTWLSVLILPDMARCFFKLNAQAVKLCISEPFDFIVPFVTLTLAFTGNMASFGFHPGCCAFFVSVISFYLTLVLLGKFCVP